MIPHHHRQHLDLDRGGAAESSADEKNKELEAARGETMEVQLKMYDLQRELDNEKEGRRRDQEKHDEVVQGLTESLESSARREAQLERASQGSADLVKLTEANTRLINELRKERDRAKKAEDDRERDAADLKRIRAERSALREEVENVKQRAKLRKDELEATKKDLESTEKQLEDLQRERGPGEPGA